MKYYFIIIHFLFLSFLFSCGNKNQGDQPRVIHKDQLQEAYKHDVRQEMDEINAYIRNQGWQMKETGTGLKYMIIKNGEGDLIKVGQEVKVNYIVKLTDGSRIYSSEGNPKGVLVGRDNIESGLHEGLQLLKKGDSARFVLPSFLAHGLTGDGNKIPPRSSVIYEIKVVEVK